MRVRVELGVGFYYRKLMAPLRFVVCGICSIAFSMNICNFVKCVLSTTSGHDRALVNVQMNLPLI